jgi:putative oxidoreductase
MDSWSDIFAPLLGRILMGGFFLWNGIEAALNFPAATLVFVNVGMPYPLSMAFAAILIEVLCGILLIVGSYTKPAATSLAIFVLCSSFLYSTKGNSGMSEAYFLQDMAIIGGLLFISAYGSGSRSPDWKFATKTKKK